MRPSPQFPKLTLDFPMTLGTFSEYVEAQRAVDYLSDHNFPVEQCMIVGTELKQVERITGRLTWGRVLLGGLASGAWLGAFVGLIFSMFSSSNGLNMVISTVLLGAIFGASWAAIGYAATRGRRDFTSVSQVVATKYEVLVEHKSVTQARDLLAQMNGEQPQAQQPTAGRTYSQSLDEQPVEPSQSAGAPQPPQYGQQAPPQYGQRRPENPDHSA